MLYSGLVSITFRKLSVDEIIKIVKKAGLDAIEWGGDIHVPHGNKIKARMVADKTEQAGLKVAAYGSYYRVGCNKNESAPFESILETALALKAPVVRVWAGDRGSDKADQEWWEQVINESRRIASLGEKAGIKVAYEYHQDTLTDTNRTAFRLLKEVDHPNIYTYWQPPHHLNTKERCTGLKQIIPWLENIHVFYWTHDPERVRHPLVEARDEWLKYLEIVAQVPGDHFAMLEFVKGDNKEQFYNDAVVLKEIIKSV